MPITSPNNESLKEIRKLAGRKWRDKLRTFVAEGEDLIAAAAAAGWEPELLLAEAGSGLAGEEVAPHLLKQYSQLGSGTRQIATYTQRWAPAPAGPVCVALWGVGDPGNVGHRAALRARLRRGQRRARAGHRGPVRAQGGARLDGRDLLRPRRAREQRRRPARPQGGAGGAQRQPAERRCAAAT